jgi:hypothetical protein
VVTGRRDAHPDIAATNAGTMIHERLPTRADDRSRMRISPSSLITDCHERRRTFLDNAEKREMGSVPGE